MPDALAQFGIVVAYAMLPAAGNFLGGLVADVTAVSSRVLNLALHLAAGIIFAVVGLELMPQALAAVAWWIPLVAFLAGSGFYVLADRLVGLMNRRSGKDEEGSPWLIFFAAAVDLFSDGIMIGTASTLGGSLGLLLAIGQTPADVPEGFAVVANFKARGTPRTKRLLVSAAFALPILLGTTIGFWAVRGAPELVKVSLLAFTGGVLLTVSSEEILTEAHEEEPSGWEAFALGVGFVLFAAISTAFA